MSLFSSGKSEQVMADAETDEEEHYTESTQSTEDTKEQLTTVPDKTPSADLSDSREEEKLTYTVEILEEEEALNFNTVRLPDKKLPYNTEKIECEGRIGKKVYRYEVRVYSDGSTCRFLKEAEIVKQPEDRVIRYGNVKETPFNEFIYPTVGRLTSDFGYRVLNGVRAFHYGVDIANAKGTSVIASDSGVVVTACKSSSYGLYVVIDHGNGYSTCYAHLSKITVSCGDKVVRGEEVGKMGSTGISTGNHLHFEIRLDETKVDPLKYLSGKLCAQWGE